eukprot:c732_g1_i1.p1 GENE.c732_g1_i1~~c732_g1_i1.p1  ORF type:complete len:537 (+),score=125.09 c732_g1_i1:53-1612(+)
MVVWTILLAAVIALTSLLYRYRKRMIQLVSGNMLTRDKYEEVREKLKDSAEADMSIHYSNTLNSEVFSFLPLRLSSEERKYLVLLEAALHVSEYTDNVDVLSYHSRKVDRIEQEMTDFFRIISGMYCAADIRGGERLVSSRSFEDNAEILAKVCEIGRRNKIVNPEKMRTTYGKLMWMLQDSVRSEVSNRMGINLKIPILTVSSYLQERNASGILKDPDLQSATKQISSLLPPETIQLMVREKSEAIGRLKSKYVCDTLTEDEVSRVIASVDDYRSYLLCNRDPVEKMIQLLKHYFQLDSDSPASLAITPGIGGSCLRHSHKQQFVFVLQSLTLWNEIMGEMFHLWSDADADLLSETTGYRLCDTGQGLNRMQPCPRVSHTMHDIVGRVQARVGSWVGLAVVHLGDRDVPNALVFIDKYTQVSRILTPIVNTIRRIDDLVADPAILAVINKHHGGVESLKVEILADFFKHGFDGSGDDGGSCIDGRLTSAWNWCSQLEKKQFYHIFLLCGFTGFDGNMG